MLFVEVLWVEPRAVCIPGKHSVTKLQPQPKRTLSLFFLQHIYLYVCVQGCTFGGGSWFSFHHVDPGDQTQVDRIGGKHLYNNLTGLQTDHLNFVVFTVPTRTLRRTYMDLYCSLVLFANNRLLNSTCWF